MAKYEDELDLLAIVDVKPTEEDVGQASVRFHDNKSGVLMKKITLQEPWDVVRKNFLQSSYIGLFSRALLQIGFYHFFQTYNHEVYTDRDTIIHIEQERNNSFCCHVYKMNRGKP